MATAKKKTTVKLELDSEEAGYLFDLLYAHVGGPLTLRDFPLGRIREALDDAGVTRLYAVNLARSEHYPTLGGHHAVLSEAE